ncbi:MAG: murein biosynthesis integral membrane protein MurJ [Spirochaetes bacterium]|nr:murein biosynthesis integral membrane protein MurJ [Spirochaetota bacterium]MBP8991684.1 murein biosynthesis integral membrane protein MurJ [Spirochaetota bacterium]HOV46669.1 murein biosynthesis integral membrane protein MurJ [Exilispira sp.]HQM89603.1 murein biosynthesis integral membrane protein MurJ [Exilispira sp.]HQQ19564.1 murein biosynthesis integral membrane protein MurJ [Exilispira sp.]
MSTKKVSSHIFKSSSGIFLSRIFGLLRDTMVTHFFKPSVQDIFNAAFKVPNTFRSIFAEGAMANSYIPVLKGIKNEEERQQFQSEFFTIYLVILTITVVALIFLVPYFMPFLVSGFEKFSEAKVTSTVYLTRFLFTYLFFISLVSFFSASMNAIFKFFIPSVSQAIFNIVFIIVLVIFVLLKKITLELFIYAVILGGFFQLAFILFYSIKYGLRFTIRWPKNFKNIKEVFKLMGPSIITSGIYQINIFISTYYLSMFDGGQTYHYVAQRLYQLPIGLFSVSMIQVFLPSFSEIVQSDDKNLIKSTFQKAFNLSLLITIPISAYMITFSSQITSILFYHGQFSYNSIMTTSTIFAIYMPGMIFITLTNMASSLFYAHKIWKSQVMVSLASIVLFFLYINLLTPVYGLNGIAAANTLNTVTQFILFYLLLVIFLKISIDKKTFVTAIKLLISSFAISVPFYLFNKNVLKIVKTSFSANFLLFLIEVAGLSLLFFMTLLVFIRILKVEELQEIISTIKVRFKNKIKRKN